jgi:steroid delta-isomerase-like uncharacterized protein
MSGPEDPPTERSLRAIREGNLKVAVRLILKAHQSGTLAIFDRLFARSFVSTSPSRPQMKGVAAYKQLILRHRAAFPDMTVEIHELIQEGNSVVARWTTRGTHRGDFFGIAPTNHPVEWTGITIFRFENARVVEQWVQSDSMTLFRQLGALSEPMRSIT